MKTRLFLKTRILRCGFVALAAAWIAGCAGMRTSETVTGSGAVPEGVQVPVVGEEVAGNAMRLRRGLVIRVKVLVAGKEEVVEPSKRVSDSGQVTLPLVGTIDTLDMPPEDLEARLAEAYGKYFVEPQVIVDVVKDERPDAMSPWGSVTVLGRVKQPGRVSIPPTMDLTVSAAIQRSGGFDSSARKTAIRVTRRGSDGKADIKEINIEAVGRRGEVGHDIVLEPNDVVFVPEMVF